MDGRRAWTLRRSFSVYSPLIIIYSLTAVKCALLFYRFNCFSSCGHHYLSLLGNYPEIGMVQLFWTSLRTNCWKPPTEPVNSCSQPDQTDPIPLMYHKSVLVTFKKYKSNFHSVFPFGLHFCWNDNDTGRSVGCFVHLKWVVKNLYLIYYVLIHKTQELRVDVLFPMLVILYNTTKNINISPMKEKKIFFCK